jgi:hypothetical protein
MVKRKLEQVVEQPTGVDAVAAEAVSGGPPPVGSARKGRGLKNNAAVTKQTVPGSKKVIN